VGFFRFSLCTVHAWPVALWVLVSAAMQVLVLAGWCVQFIQCGGSLVGGVATPCWLVAHRLLHTHPIVALPMLWFASGGAAMCHRWNRLPVYVRCAQIAPYHCSNAVADVVTRVWCVHALVALVSSMVVCGCSNTLACDHRVVASVRGARWV
jgi:hypothetical protein